MGGAEYRIVLARYEGGHWLIMYYPTNSSKGCYWLNCTARSDRRGRDTYDIRIVNQDSGAKRKHPSITRAETIGHFYENEKKNVGAMIMKLRKGNCHECTIEMVRLLESKGYVERGTSHELKREMKNHGGCGLHTE